MAHSTGAPAVKAGEPVRLRVRAMAHGGEGIADAPDGRVVFVRDAIPGDTVAATPVSYTHLTLPTTLHECRSRWSPYH